MPFSKPNGALHKALFDNLIDGLAYCGIIRDENGRAIDWEYVNVNPAFEKQSGLSDVIGRRVSEVVPDLLEHTPLLEIYERVARTGRHERFEQYIDELQMWFDISVYSFERDTFVALFENITVPKKLLLELEKANREILAVYDQTLQSWARALEIKDRETRGHSMRVVEMAETMARKMDYPERDLVGIRRGALLHDIGKMAISDAVLHKPGRLDPEERELMQQHPQIAYDILLPIRFLDGCALDVPYCHHELLDGSGYPRGLVGNEIPECARLFTVVDVFDAMTSDRPYRKALSRKFTLEYIEVKSGILYDPDVVNIFLKLIRK
jgi:putative nucleotidyltransferase with HDIG domain